MDTWGVPFCCCEASKDEACATAKYTFTFSLSDSQRPSLLIATPMEICVLPPISGSIINPLESSLRKSVSNKFEYHLPMFGSSKGLGSCKICLGVVFQIGSGKDWLNNRYFCYHLSFRFFRCRLRMRFLQGFFGLLELSLQFWDFLRKLFVFLFIFFEIFTESSDCCILFLGNAS
jgi:hypothetical protein